MKALTPAQIEKVVEHLQAALAILQPEENGQDERNPHWFRDTGHLTDAGIAHLFSLFERGVSIYAAAKEMKISYRATALRHADWKKKNA
ncbi:hypothetical protein N2605_00185 [Bradyrhizobium yuanmingense]|uniref:hypothetical protein n=1 Tax=Bradyrhizobium yuanmingense TaxID=108015 RepID=UPI0021A3A584|nr:hypothetical protein [Bradyrhizobium sp. CB1024]UWU84918.1 hypothetical protein N2605_00185 [Bradyrhizobium sp. CB1024]